MTERTLSLFPDTNVFIQCKPLKELDWSEWSEFSEIHLLVSRPVQREIDDQKNRGNNRVANRARTTHQLFRKIIDGRQEYELIRNSFPSVKLYLEGLSRPSPELEGMLDPNKPDDQIVGCLYRFRQDHQGLDARLLTFDAGPMMTANSLGIPYVAVKDEWLLPPENNEIEKENTRLRERIARIEKAEPQFQIKLMGDGKVDLERLDLEYIVYEPPSSEEVRSLIKLIADNFPKTTGFPRSDLTRRENSTTPEIFTPPTEEEITKYLNRDYPDWIKACEASLSNTHNELQAAVDRLSFTIEIANEGTRPGNDTLVNIEAKGNFRIRPPLLNDESEKTHREGPGLPHPPRPPQGKWSTASRTRNKAMGFDLVSASALKAFNFFPKIPATPYYESIIKSISRERERDPNAVYFKPDRPSTPVEIVTLECRQWRHNTGEIPFRGEIVFDSGVDEIQGALLCEIHAENLSQPAIRQFPVRITIRSEDSTEHAQNLVQIFIDKVQGHSNTV